LNETGKIAAEYAEKTLPANQEMIDHVVSHEGFRYPEGSLYPSTMQKRLSPTGLPVSLRIRRPTAPFLTRSGEMFCEIFAIWMAARPDAQWLEMVKSSIELTTYGQTPSGKL